MDENTVENNVSVLEILDNQSGTYKQTLSIVNYHNHGQINNGQTQNHAINQEDIDDIESNKQNKFDIIKLEKSNNYHNHGHYINKDQTQSHAINKGDIDCIESNKQSIIWTKNSTITLLSLYETKISILDNPKKKSKMWTSIAEELKAMGIEVTPDQVRWKINALTKKYKDCIDNGQGPTVFKYFNEMHHILGYSSNESGTYRLASGAAQGIEISSKERYFKNMPTKTSVPQRKLRTERNAKIDLDKKWIEYIQKQDEQRIKRDERYERSLKLKEEELQLRKKELEIKHSLALKKLQLKEKKQEEMLKIEREKCMLLRKLLANQ